jgi:hypothetical protein
VIGPAYKYGGTIVRSPDEESSRPHPGSVQSFRHILGCFIHVRHHARENCPIKVIRPRFSVRLDKGPRSFQRGVRVVQGQIHEHGKSRACGCMLFDHPDGLFRKQQPRVRAILPDRSHGRVANGPGTHRRLERRVPRVRMITHVRDQEAKVVVFRRVVGAAVRVPSLYGGGFVLFLVDQWRVCITGANRKRCLKVWVLEHYPRVKHCRQTKSKERRAQSSRFSHNRLHPSSVAYGTW